MISVLFAALGLFMLFSWSNLNFLIILSFYCIYFLCKLHFIDFLIILENYFWLLLLFNRFNLIDCDSWLYYKLFDYFRFLTNNIKTQINWSKCLINSRNWKITAKLNLISHILLPINMIRWERKSTPIKSICRCRISVTINSIN